MTGRAFALASALYGQFDENLARLEQKLGVDIRSRGNQLTIRGSADAAEVRIRAICRHACVSPRLRIGAGLLSSQARG